MSAEIFRPVDIYLAIQKPESLYWQFAISTFQEWRQMLMSGKEIKVEFNDFKENLNDTISVMHNTKIWLHIKVQHELK